MVAVNFAPTSLLEPKLNRRPMAGPRIARSPVLSRITDYSRIAAGPADSRAIERKMPE